MRVAAYSAMAGVRPALVAFALLALASPVLAQVPCANPAPADCVIASSVTVPTGTEWDVGARALTVASGKTITVQTQGYFTIRAASITLESSAKIVAPGSDGYGGLVSLEASGGIELKSLTRIDVSANEGAGVITIAANGGTLVSQGELRAKASNKIGSGGFVTLLGGSAVTIGGEGIDASGGTQADGGYIEIYSSGGITISSLLNASGGDYGAGEVDIDAEGSVVSSSGGIIDVQSRNGSGSGGSVLVAAGQNVALSAGVVGIGSAGGSEGDGYGGEVELYAENGDVLSGPLDLRGGGTNGFGGALTVEAGGAVVLGQVLASSKANGFGRGGEIDLQAGTSLDVASTVDVRGGIVGGSLAGRAGATATVSGTILASGTTLLPPATSARAGLVTITACSVDLPFGSVITNLGTADPERGVNRLQASNGMVVDGILTAGNANVLEWRDVFPTLGPDRSVTPQQQIFQNANLQCCGGGCTTTTSTSTTTSSTSSTTSTTTSTVPETTTTSTTSTSTSSTVPQATTSTTTATTAPSSTTIPQTTTSTTSSTSSTTLDTTTSSTIAPATTTTSTVVTPSTTSTTTPTLPSTTSTTLPTECTDLPLVGFEAVDCRLDTIGSALAAEPVETLGGKKWATKLDRAVARARSALAVARTGRKVTPNLRRANKQLHTFQKSVTRAQSNGMPAVLGSKLMALATGATSEIGALRSAQR